MHKFTRRGRGFNLPQGPVTYKYIEVGKTLYHAPSIGTPRFSLRLAYRMLNELLAAEEGITAVYDPFCGNGVLLVTAFLLFAQRLQKIIGSDLSLLAMDSARRNMQWLRDAKALEERLYAIESYATEDVELKEVSQQRCKLMFEHAKGIDMEVELFAQDATCIGARLAAVEGEVAIVTDPPYAHPCDATRRGATSALCRLFWRKWRPPPMSAVCCCAIAWRRQYCPYWRNTSPSKASAAPRGGRFIIASRRDRCHNFQANRALQLRPSKAKNSSRGLPCLPTNDRHQVELEKLYGTDLHQRGASLPDLDLRPIPQRQLACLRPEEVGQPQYTLEGWLERIGA